MHRDRLLFLKRGLSYVAPPSETIGMCVSRPLLPRISAVHFAHRVRTGGSQVALKGGHSVQFQTWVELKFAT